MTAKVLTLARPVKVAGGEVAELRLREPTGEEMREAEKELLGGEVTSEAFSAYQVALLAGVTSVDREVLLNLPNSVADRAFEYVSDFNTHKADPVPPDVETLTLLVVPPPAASNGLSYPELVLREPTLGERRKAEMTLRGGSTPSARRSYQMQLVAACAEVPFEVAKKLPVSVLNAAEAFLRGFISGGRGTGSV